MKRNLNNLVLFIFALAGLIFSSCEYDSDDMNYHELPRPEKEVTATLNLPDVPKGQTLYIYAPTNVSYTVNISSGTIIEKQFYLDNRPLTENEGTIQLSPNIMQEGKASVLKVTLRQTSGTGSLAEILGGEKSELITLTYPVKYVNPDIKLNIKQRINKDKNLELYWVKPTLDGAEVEGYKIYYYNIFDEVLVNEITNPDQTWFVDKNYVYGSQTYRIVTKYKSGKIRDKEDFYTTKYETITNENFSGSVTKDFRLNIKINNPNRYNCKYVLKTDNEVINIGAGKTEGVIKRPPFPMGPEATLYYRLYILPKDANNSDYQKYPEVINYFQDPFLGNTYAKYEGSFRYVADKKSKQILGFKPIFPYWGFRAYNTSNLELANKTGVGDNKDFEAKELSTSPNTGLVSILYERKRSSIFSRISVYSDYTLKTLINKFYAESYTVWFLTNDDKIILNHEDRRENHIYNVRTGEKIASQRETTGTEFRPAISADGKYIFNYLRINDTWYKLYHFENGKFNLLNYQTNSGVTNIVFNPTNDRQVIMQNKNNSFSIYEIPSLNKIKTIEGQFLAIDTFTGNIFYLDKSYSANKKAYILNNTYDKNIFSFTINDRLFFATEAVLINNTVILSEQYFKIPE